MTLPGAMAYAGALVYADMGYRIEIGATGASAIPVYFHDEFVGVVAEAVVVHLGSQDVAGAGLRRLCPKQKNEQHVRAECA